MNVSHAEQKSEDVEPTLRFYIFGGWCPNVTSLKEIDVAEFEKKENYEDVPIENREEVELTFKVDHTSKYISSIICGIPEVFFVHADIQFCPGGIFLISVSFTKDWGKREDISDTLHINQIITLSQNIIYREIKVYHHTHTHHHEEADNLLTLLYLEEATGKNKIKLENKQVKKYIFDHIYKQYSIEKPDIYVNRTIELLGDTPTPSQLEEAILFLYQGIGEMAFGIAFLKKYGSIFLNKLVEVNMEYIGLESIMRNLDALRGKLFFDYIRSTKSARSSGVIKDITEGITSAAIDKLAQS